MKKILLLLALPPLAFAGFVGNAKKALKAADSTVGFAVETPVRAAISVPIALAKSVKASAKSNFGKHPKVRVRKEKK